MMNYETFKNVIKVRVQNELPVVFKECKVQIHEVEKNNVLYECISGDYYERFMAAKSIIENELHITTVF